MSTLKQCLAVEYASFIFMKRLLIILFLWSFYSLSHFVVMPNYSPQHPRHWRSWLHATSPHISEEEEEVINQFGCPSPSAPISSLISIVVTHHIVL